MEEILKDFPQQTAAVMKLLLDSEMEEHTIRRTEDGMRLECRCDMAMEYDVDLLGASGLPEDADGWYFGPAVLSRDGAGYVLTGTIEDERREEWIDVTLRFEGVEARVWAIRADLDLMYDDPWMNLSSAAFSIVRKEDCVPWLVNDRERELLPLLRELAALKFMGDHGSYAFPILKTRLPDEIVPMLEKLEQAAELEELRRCSDRLSRTLRKVKYAPYWEDLHREIGVSQLGYPDHDRKDSEIVRKITDYLHDRGYLGSYPDFRKRGTVAKTRWLAADGRYFLVRKGQPLNSYIRCRASRFEGEDHVSFFSGAELPTPGGPIGVDFCRFRSDGKRFRSQVFLGFGTDCGNLSEKLSVVVKNAELLPMNRAERKLNGKVSFFAVFFWTFLLAGGFYAVLFTPAYALVSYFIGMLFDGFGGLGEYLREFPWLQMFAGCWLLAGGVFGAFFSYLVTRDP